MPVSAAFRHALQSTSAIIPCSTTRLLLNAKHRIGTHSTGGESREIIAQTTFFAPRKSITKVSTTFNLPPNQAAAGMARRALSTYPVSVVRDVQMAYEQWHASETGRCDGVVVLDAQQRVTHERMPFSMPGEHSYPFELPIPTLSWRARAEIPCELRLKQLADHDSTTVMLLSLTSSLESGVSASTQCRLTLPFTFDQTSLPAAALSALEVSLSALMTEFSFGLYLSDSGRAW